jgi:4-hydroxy-tetrahydrodipicolinate synthase
VNDASVVVALLTPFAEDGRPDMVALHHHVEWLVHAGVDAVMPAGTTGEGPLLEEDEVVACVATAAAAAAGRIAVLAHVGRAGTDATIRLAHRTVGAGALGVSAVVPYYYAVDEGHLVEHYRALRGAVPDVPVYAYTIPARTGNELSPAAAGKLAQAGLAGLKDSTKSMERHVEYLEATRDHPFRVLMGSDGMVLDALRAGAAGCVSAVANARPDLLVGLTRAFLGGRVEEAERHQAEVTAVREKLSRGPSLAGIKRATARALADAGTDYPVRLRPPLG